MPVFHARGDGEVYKKGAGHFMMDIETGMNLTSYFSGHNIILSAPQLVSLIRRIQVIIGKYLNFVNKAIKLHFQRDQS